MWTSVLLSAAAGAWVPHGSTWAWEDTPVSEGFELNTGTFPYPDNDVEAAWVLALDIWNAQGESYVYLRNAGLTTVTAYAGGDNGHNLSRFTNNGSGGTLALASWSIYGGGMVDCDIEFYGSNSYGTVNWSFDPAGAPSGWYDFTQTAVHELGHCIGLSHSSVPGARMAPTNSPGTGWDHRLLHADEIAGLQSMYGAGAVELELSLELPGPVAAGERAEVVAHVKNVGTAPSVDVLGVLLADSPLELLLDAGSLGDLPPGAVRGTEGDALRFEVRIREDCDTNGAEITVEVEDVAGNKQAKTTELTLDCVDPSNSPPGSAPWPGGTLAPPEEPDLASLGCGCNTKPRSAWSRWPLLLHAWSRRR